ncbi:hypothetical protein [Nonomuraea sp. NPDC049480]|uniref:hypothetical protein n=1 Tax=Nonomuraea sp. NPDC049480 TaxID=3364353 RepID=UPI00378CED74
MKITAAVPRGPRQPFVLEEVELAEPDDGEILVRMVAIDAQDLIAGGKTVRGSIEGDAVPAGFLPRLPRMRANGSLPVEKLIITYPFEEIGQAVARAGVAVEPVLVF